MSEQTEFYEIWQERVDSLYLYRGMSEACLGESLHPRNDPIRDYRSKVFRLLDILERLVNEGLEFTLVEEHWGARYEHKIEDIIEWTRGDLRNPGIDFTASYEAACEYSDNWQGSQIKQNLKYIADHLPHDAMEPPLRTHMQPEDWQLLSEIGAWVSEEGESHRAIVIWVRRSCPVFRAKGKCLPVDRFESFRENLLREIRRRGLPATSDSALEILPSEPSEFCLRIENPLEKSNIERIEYTEDVVRKRGHTPSSG
jgi:hypothetical protein